MLPGDRLICSFVATQSVGLTFKDWLPHITIVPWFRLDTSSANLARLLKKGYVGTHSFEVTVKEEAQFGYRNHKTVNLLVADELFRLEGQTRRVLHAQRAWVVDEADKTRRGFQPHVTVLPRGRVQQGDNFRCDKVYIVSQHGDYKQIDCVVVL